MGRLRSAGYGYTVKRTIGTVYLSADIEGEGEELAVEVLGDPIAAFVAPDVLHDPDGSRLRA